MGKLMGLALALACAGCAAQRQMTWSRADGRPFALDSLTLDQTVCRGEMQKANLSAPSNSRGGGYALADVFVGCMADRKWVQVPVD